MTTMRKLQLAGYRVVECSDPPPGERHRFVFVRVDASERIVWVWKLTPPDWREHAATRALASAGGDSCLLPGLRQPSRPPESHAV